MESKVNPHANYHIIEQITPMPDTGDSPIGISLDDVRRAGPRADLAHASRIRRTVAQRRRVPRPPKEAKAIEARPAVDIQPALDFTFAPLPAAEGLPNPHQIPHLYTAAANNWHPPGFVEEETESTEMDEHGRIIPDESYGADEEITLKIESPGGESSLALIEGHRRAGESLTPLTAKRPRGRPRKHPILCESASKMAKGRSKTGCITCRKRKKKCDETKPRCMNCEKNAVVCEGYPERMVWKSGRERAGGMPTWTRQMPDALNVSTDQFSMATTLPNIQLQPVIHGVETAGDRIFFEHYVFRLSSVLTVEGPQKNAFKDMLLPMAVKHLGLMHSILSLSSSNMDYQSDYGKAILAKHTDVDQKMLEERAQFHQDEAVKEFFLDIERQQNGGDENAVLPVIYGQMLCFVVKSLTEGQTTGAHRVHLQAYQKLIRETPPEDSPFMDFVNEYFQFHIALDGLVSIPQPPPDDDDDATSLAGPLPPPPILLPPDAAGGDLFGIEAPLFSLMSHITQLRTRIRRNLARGTIPAVDYHCLHRATVIDAAIRAWQPPAPPHHVRHVTGLLYRQMLWVYLWRSIYPPSASAWAPDRRIADAVDGALELLRLVPPDHPCQTLLLAPTFVVGCAAFEGGQRVAVRESVRVIKGYAALKNADRALEVLEAVWRCMDARDERSWDWQGIAGEMEMDFLAT